MKIYRLRSWIYCRSKRSGKSNQDILFDEYFAGRVGLKTAKKEYARLVRDMKICHFSYSNRGEYRSGVVVLRACYVAPDTGRIIEDRGEPIVKEHFEDE